MDSWIVEYYGEEGEWLECSNNFWVLDDAIRCMRLHAENDSDLAHRLVEIKRNTVALSMHGEELVK